MIYSKQQTFFVWELSTKVPFSVAIARKSLTLKCENEVDHATQNPWNEGP